MVGKNLQIKKMMNCVFMRRTVNIFMENSNTSKS